MQTYFYIWDLKTTYFSKRIGGRFHWNVSHFLFIEVVAIKKRSRCLGLVLFFKCLDLLLREEALHLGLSGPPSLDQPVEQVNLSLLEDLCP